jgi:regulatory protein
MKKPIPYKRDARHCVSTEPPLGGRGSRTLTYDQALFKVAAICTQSEKCESDIRTKLLAWEISESDANKIITYLKEEKFLDDARYCSFFVKDKSRFNKWGKIKIGYALRAKKIDEELIVSALGQIDEEEAFSTLISILNTKSRNLKYKDEYDKKGKLIRFGLSRGFEMGLINRALKIVK